MGIWYEGNLNKEENRHEEKGITYFIRGVRAVGGVRYERYAVKTHFIERGEDYVGIVRRYLSPLCQPGDVVTISEKVISMCQNNTVEMKDIRVGFWARFLSRFATHNHNGIGMDEPYKLQLAINMRGLPLILWASFCGAVCRLFGKRGVFYEIVGQDVAGIDGFYSHSAFETYHTLAVLNPREPDKVCAEIEKETGIACVLVDANDIDVEILGRAPSLAECSDQSLSELIRDNPAGQDDELTPFVIVRDIGDREAMPYVPVEAIEGPAEYK
ncbi:MAG: F420-0--gamma-glutamyl ligase [Clostridiales bacterium]|nr:F420-0--gamma-glutamyl ligase [Clostridiales bacterium]